MAGELDPFAFLLAERLGMTVEALLDTMSNREFLMWGAFERWRAAQGEHRG